MLPNILQDRGVQSDIGSGFLKTDLRIHSSVAQQRGSQTAPSHSPPHLLANHVLKAK